MGKYDTTVVTVSGLDELRKAFIGSSIESKKEMRKVVKTVATAIVPKAKRNVRHKATTLMRAGYVPGKLARNIRAGTSGDKGIIRVSNRRVPYSRIVEFGGSFGAGASRTLANLNAGVRVRSLVRRSEAQAPIRRAIQSEGPRGARELERALTSLFRRHELLAD